MLNLPSNSVATSPARSASLRPTRAKPRHSERSVTSDIYASVTANQDPGEAVEALWRLSSKGSAAGFQAAAYGAALQLQATSKPVDLGGIWGLERVLEVRNIIASGDGTAGASTVKGTAFRLAFG